jgi:hypothetical protein
MSERRQDRRISIIFRSEFLSAEKSAGEGSVQDLSIRGCRVRAASTVQLNDTFRMQLFLPQCSPPIHIEQARVRWVNGQEFGCQFLSMLPDERARLLEVLTALERDTAGSES